MSTKTEKDKSVSRYGTLISNLNHPVRIPYGTSVIIVPPQGRISNVDKNLLGAYPKGITFVSQ